MPPTWAKIHKKNSDAKYHFEIPTFTAMQSGREKKKKISRDPWQVTKKEGSKSNSEEWEGKCLRCAVNILETPAEKEKVEWVETEQPILDRGKDGPWTKART